jgi:hypothetical protein
MIRPKQSDIGRQVAYQGGHPDDRHAGVLTSFSAHHAFVRYGMGSTSAGTRFVDLTWAHPIPGDELDATAGEGEVG